MSLIVVPAHPRLNRSDAGAAGVLQVHGNGRTADVASIRSAEAPVRKANVPAALAA